MYLETDTWKQNSGTIMKMKPVAGFMALPAHMAVYGTDGNHNFLGQRELFHGE